MVLNSENIYFKINNLIKENRITIRNFLKFHFLVFLLTLLACIGESPHLDPTYIGLLNKESHSPNGAVSTPHPLATQAGVDMLEAGGNAVDAAVAAAFVLSVVEPTMSGIGGRSQILISLSSGKVFGIDATTQAPTDYDYKNSPKKRYGYPSIGVPGAVRGLTRALREHGSLPLSQVLKPAILLAENGHSLISGEALRQGMVNVQLNEFEGSRKYFLRKDGTPRIAGDWIIQEDLGRVLRAIAEKGADVFYEGWIADMIVEDNQANGGVLTLQALKDYKAEHSHIVEGSYKGFELKSLYIPAYGAITIEALHILESLDKNMKKDRIWGEAIYQAILASYLDRKEQKTLKDAERLTSKKWADKRADDIKKGRISARIGMDKSFQSTTENIGHTAHLTIVDKEGMIVALTQTLGTIFGSKVATPGLGFAYAQTLGGYLGEIQPGERASSHISPILIRKKGIPFLALGAAGGSRIPSSIVSVISRIVDQNHSLPLALSLPRIHPTKEGLELEFTGNNGWVSADSIYFSKLGYIVSVQRDEGRFGRIHAIIKDSLKGHWIGAADPDWQGSALAPKNK